MMVQIARVLTVQAPVSGMAVPCFGTDVCRLNDFTCHISSAFDGFINLFPEIIQQERRFAI
jgi:hypothetical protein